MRGRRGRCRPQLEVVRTNPACTGTTRSSCSTSPRSPDHPRRVRGRQTLLPGKRPYPSDHPRVCGDDRSTGPSWLSADGPPPRVRGRLVGCAVGLHRGRTTPACAGTTAPGCQSRRRRTDHPACAGTTHPGPGPPPIGQDYPRVCGDDSPGPRPPPIGQDYPRVCGDDSTTPGTNGRTIGPPRVCGDDV